MFYNHNLDPIRGEQLLERIIRSHRKPLQLSYRSHQDLMNDDVATALNYICSERKLSQDEAFDLMVSDKLPEVLQDECPAACRPIPFHAYAWVPFHYVDHPPDKFACNVPGVAIYADTTPQTYRYADGTTLPYRLIQHEVSANCPLTTTGMGYRESGTWEWFIRAHGVALHLAALHQLRDHPKIARYKRVFPFFAHDIVGIVLSHEKSETEIWDTPDFQDVDPVQAEVNVERYSRVFLRGKIPDESYLLYHQLRCLGDEDNPDNISAQVLREL